MTIHPKKLYYYYTAQGALISSVYESPSLAQYRITYFSYLKLSRCNKKPTVTQLDIFNQIKS